MESAKFIALPDTNSISSGYLNLDSTGFRVEVQLSSGYAPSSIGLYIDSCPNQIDMEVYDTARSYILSSGTSTHPQLEQLLSSCSPQIEGSHQVGVKASDLNGERLLWQDSFIADFTNPDGNFAVSNLSGKSLLKVGDKVEIAYTPTTGDTSEVSGKIYDRELTWLNEGGRFVSNYQIKEGDPDCSANLLLSSVMVQDMALNQTDYGKIAIPINFSIDANSPTLSITSPSQDAYNTDKISLRYTATGYSDIQIYLDNRIISILELKGLSDGQHEIKIIASDLAGNKAVARKSFNIDTIAPAGSLIDPPSQINESDNLILNGTTEPGATVKLEVGTNKMQTVADKSGRFSFEINGLEAGDYQILLTLIDKMSNQRTILIGSLSVIAKTESVLNISGDEGVKVAKADVASNVTSDTKTSLNLPHIDEENSVNIGRIIGEGASAERFPPNYQSWLILSAIIIFSLFLSAISYNFYSRFVAAKELNLEAEIISKEYIQEESVFQDNLPNKPEVLEDEKPPPPNEPTLRW